MASVFEFLREFQPFLKETEPRDAEGMEQGGSGRLAEKLSPCYFLHGDEPFLGRKALDLLQRLLLTPDSRDFNLDRFWMDESGWADVIDAARTAPTFFSPWRLTVAEFLIRGEDRTKDRDEDTLSEIEVEILEEYLEAPRRLPGTILVVVYPSRFRRYMASPVCSFFSKHFIGGRTRNEDQAKRESRTAKKDKLPKDNEARKKGKVVSLEMNSLKGKDLQSWLHRELDERRLSLTPEAREHLVLAVGNDLGRLAVEMDKLQSYSGDTAKAPLDAEVVDSLCAWTREIEAWGLADALAVADWPRCAEVIDRLFKEGESELKILNDIAGFFREVRLAKAWLEDKSRDRKAVFAALRPQIKENYVSLYSRKFREFFLPVERLSRPQLRRVFLSLSRIDAALKSGGAEAKREMLEVFLFEYCRTAKNVGLRRTPGG